MDKKTVFIKTAKGESEVSSLSGDLRRAMSLIDNKSTVEEIVRRAPPSLREDLADVLRELLAGEFIRDKDASLVETRSAGPKIATPKMFVPKPSVSSASDELDFTKSTSAHAANAADLAKQKVEDAARGRAELEAAVAAAKARASAELTTKAEAKARQDADVAARARAEADVKAKQEAKIREQAEAKAREEAAARMRAAQEAARVKAELETAVRAKAEAEARIRAEIEAAARAKQVAEEKARQAAEEARLKAEQQAARIRAELEAAARAKAEAEEKARREAEENARRAAEERARQEAEAARLKAAQEAAAARLKAEQEAAARARAETEARALAEAQARREAETAAQREAEEQARRAKVAAAQEALASAAKEMAAAPEAESAFEINLESFLGATQQPEPRQTTPAVDQEARAAAEEKNQLEAEQRAAAAEKKSKQSAAAEMARLKAEAEAKADAARRKIEEDARRQAEEQALAAEQAKAWAEAEQRAKVQAQIDAEQAAQQAALAQAKAAKKPVSRARRAPLPLGKIAFGLVALALVVAVALPYVYPLQEYVAPLEQRLSALLKQPVRIGGLSAASLPPKLQLQNVTIGSTPGVKIGSVELYFDLLTLLSETKVISNAKIEEVSIEGSQLDRQMASLQSLGGDARYPLRHMTLQRVKVVTDEIALPVLSGVADVDAQGVFSRVSLHSADDKLGIELQPKQARWQLGVNLKESSLPILPDVVFSDISAKGNLSDGEVNFTEMDAHIYNGILLGRAKLNWRKGWQLQGQLEAKTFELNKMFPKYGVEGELFGEGTFSMTGAKLSQIGESQRLDASFTVKNGLVSGFDMVETARLLSREHMVGGRTHFDDMIGVLQLENHVLRFRQLRIVSGMLSANGSFDVSPGNQLSGSFNAEIKMRGGNNLLTLFGKLDEPKMRAGR